MPATFPPVIQRRAVFTVFGLTAVALGTGWAWQQRQKDLAPTMVDGQDDVCLVAPPTPYDSASGLPMTAARPVPAQARCPVCGMFPARSLDWAAQTIFSNGDVHFFDSPLSLFMFLQDVERYSPGRSAQDIVAWYVNDSAQRPAPQWVDARSAFYVHGSDARGPMRAGNLPAFAQKQAAEAFAQRRGGKVLAFAEVDAALVRELGGRSGLHEGH